MHQDRLSEGFTTSPFGEFKNLEHFPQNVPYVLVDYH